MAWRAEGWHESMGQHVRPALARQPGRSAKSMELTSQAHLAAGLGALALGLAVFLRDPRRRSSRLFGELCGFLSAWMLGRVLEMEQVLGWTAAWHELRLAGACLAAPQALRLVVAMTGSQRSWHRVGIAGSFALGIITYSVHRLPVVGERPVWPAMAAVALGLPLVASLRLLRRHARERGGMGMGAGRLAAASIVAVIAALSDLIPRDRSVLPPLGPLGLIAFLIVLAAVVARGRYLDADRTVARLVAITLGAAAAALFAQAVVAALGESGFAYFLACLVIVSVSGPFLTALLEGTRALLDRGGLAVAQVIGSAAHGLRHATDEREAWSALVAVRERIPSGMRWHVLVARTSGSDLVEHEAHGAPLALPATATLAASTSQDGGPIVLPVLADDTPSRQAAGAEIDRLGARAAVVIACSGRTAGILLVGGAAPDRWLSRDVLQALQAVAYQAGETLARVEAQRAARRSAALAAVGELAAGLAHEVRNPVAAIHGAAQVLADSRDPGLSREMLNVIDEESRRLGGVLAEFLAWARPGAPRMTSLDLEEAVRLALRESELAGFGLPAEITREESVPHVRADPELLRRALVNILRNSREACGESGRLVMHVAQDAAGGARVRIEDDGPGLPAEVRARLFEPFVTTKARGTGLGLPLVHRVIAEMGGSVLVDSEPGHGTAFTLVLCAADAPRHDARQEEA